MREGGLWGKKDELGHGGWMNGLRERKKRKKKGRKEC